ncbi:MAG: hypothetical protein IKS22_07150 [Bacteroidales bacterium]|nr:hypothetical protein [Bacteroidales bacterium]
MKRTKDYTADAVKESIGAAMSGIKAYFDKEWTPGKEYDVIKHIHALLDAEIDKYVAPGAAGDAYRHLASYAPGSKKYEAAYAKYLEKFGPYLMELFVEYADSLKLTGRYDVGERYNEVSRDILEKMKKSFLSTENIEQMLDTETEAIDKFMQRHGVDDYSITMGTIGLAVIVGGDITLTKEDAPRGQFRHDFKKVSGDFICRDCGLKDLLFGPEEVGGDFDCSNNKLTSLSDAPKVVGGNFICEGNDKKFTYTEIKRHTKVGGRIYTDAPLTPEEKEDFRQRLIKEQNEFLKEYRAVGNKLEKAIGDKDIKTIEKCREYYYDAIDFFKERPWIKKQGMELSHDILMKIYVHLHDFNPSEYPDITAEEFKLRKILRD